MFAEPFVLYFLPLVRHSTHQKYQASEVKRSESNLAKIRVSAHLATLAFLLELLFLLFPVLAGSVDL